MRKLGSKAGLFLVGISLHAVFPAAASAQSAVAAPEFPDANDDIGKAGAFYRSFMDTAAIEALDAKPLEADLAAIRAASDRSALAALMGHSVDSLNGSIFGLSVFADLKDSDRNALYVDQGGLGLPDREIGR